MCYNGLRGHTPSQPLRLPGRYLTLEGLMKSLSAKDASILTLIAENPRMSFERMTDLVGLADDEAEVKEVARLLLNPTVPNGVAPSEQAIASAEALRVWVSENRALSVRE